MNFNSLEFFLFLLIVFALYWLLQKGKLRIQNAFLLIASYVFYGWWDWRFLSLIIFSTLIDYAVGLRIGSESNLNLRKRWLVVSIVTNLGLLCFFKYFNFFIDSWVSVWSGLGFEINSWSLDIILPVGISFYTFQTLSYSIDIYRERLKPTKDLLSFAVFVSFFPQLVAGPIERAKVLLPQITNPRKFLKGDIEEGVFLILLGFFLKSVVGDNSAILANALFNSPLDYKGLDTWFGVYAFSFQIFGDFAGYTSIARGVSLLLGIRLNRNFHNPYFATNPSDFWNRWHISLSSWLKDYLYISLGGNRKGNLFTIRNLYITMLLGGLWHGASWNFVLWGGFHGTLLALYHQSKRLKLFSEFTKFNKAKKLFSIFIMFHLTCFSWILFRINKLSDLGVILNQLVDFSSESYLLFTRYNIFFFSFLIACLFVFSVFLEKYNDEFISRKWHWIPQTLTLSFFLGVILLFGVVENFEFIYFQF